MRRFRLVGVGKGSWRRRGDGRRRLRRPSRRSRMRRHDANLDGVVVDVVIVVENVDAVAVVVVDVVDKMGVVSG